MEFSLLTKVKFRLIKHLTEKLKTSLWKEEEKLRKVVHYWSVPVSLHDWQLQCSPNICDVSHAVLWFERVHTASSLPQYKLRTLTVLMEPLLFGKSFRGFSKSHDFLVNEFWSMRNLMSCEVILGYKLNSLRSCTSSGQHVSSLN